jgi:hypothetical protein
MEDSIPEERIIEAYRAALRYGPEPFDNEPRAKHVTTSKMFDFLMMMKDSDVFTSSAYHKAGQVGVDVCCVDWMQEIAEETGDLQEFIESLLDGYGEGREVWYVYDTNAGDEKAGPFSNKENAVRSSGMFQADKGEKHHIVKRYEDE